MQRAQLDPGCSARIVGRRGLYYDEGASPLLDRPAHVRAASSTAWLGARLAIVQDDANFIALVDPQTGAASSITLPAGADGKRLFDDLRGTKHAKLDLEACFSVFDLGQWQLVALGSGSEPPRERVVQLVFAADAAEVASMRVIDASAFYAQLHARHDFCGAELNLEGALVRGDTLLLVQRGNGATTSEDVPFNALGELSWPQFQAYLADPSGPVPTLTRVTPFELGERDGVRFTFTDATLTPAGNLLFVASAEASSDSVTDGAVHGTRIGHIAEDGTTRMAPLQNEDGTESLLKAEGMVLDRTDARRAWIVVDMDDPALPALLLEIALTFPA